MTSTARRSDRKIDDLLDKAAESLARGMLFEAERIADKALMMARQDNHFEHMTRAIPILKQSRRTRLKKALSVGKVTVVDVPITEDMKIAPGAYLIQPPQVGSDARRLRLAAFQNDVPVVVLCREPLTTTRLVPVVVIGPGSTVRTKVPPPADASKPDLVWFVAALEELGDWAITSIDDTLPPTRRIDALLDSLNALPEHEPLHDALEAACKTAAQAGDADEKRPASGRQSKTKIKS